MNPIAIIETYVADVVRRLPRAKRTDVAFELRSLLLEELDGRATDAGHPADAAMAIDLLKGFGSPVDVADRYRPAGFTIIRPADAPRFALVAFVGVAVQWVLSLIATFSVPLDPTVPGGDWLSRLGGWWLTWGLGAFWFPGFIVTLTMIAALIGSRRAVPDEPRVPTIRELDRDRVNRAGLASMIALGVVGAATLLAIPTLAQWAGWLPQPVIDGFELDGDFLAWRAPWVLLLWAASLAIGIAVLAAGRWTPLTRRLSAAVAVAWVALLIWWLVAGPIFTGPLGDGVVKGCLGALAVVCAIWAVLDLRRASLPIPVPTV